MLDRPPLTMEDLLDAWRQVAENEGCAGVDGITLQRFAQSLERHCERLLTLIHSAAYRPLPLLRIVVEKSPGSAASRTLLVPAVRDRIVQTAVARMLSRSYEEEFLDVSFAYRPGRGVDRAIARLRQLRDLGFDQVYDADIRAFFDSVSFEKLEQQLSAAGEPAWLLSLVSAWLRVPGWDGQRLRYRSRGLPQGSPISPLLANFFLLPLDLALATQSAKLVRYADDFVILAQSPDELEVAAERAKDILANLDLAIHPGKSQFTSFSEGFRFLGVYFQKDEIWKPWKENPKPLGRLIAMASPMPERLLAPYLQTPDAKSWESQLRSEGLRWRPPASQSKPNRREETNRVAYLYLTQQGSVLRKSGDRFLVELDNEILLDLPYDKLEHILLFGNVQVTTQAIGELLDKGVDLSFFSWRGQFRGSLMPPKSANIQDRLLQLELWRNSANSLALARNCVANKIRNQMAVLQHSCSIFGVVPPEPETIAPEAAQAARDIPSLMGVEGAAAREYFQRLGGLIPQPFVWAGRQARPAKDPINALLSLSYTLLTRELASLVEAEGLETSLGALHQLDRGRPSLALDLVEAFRAPVADRFVLTLLRQSHFNLEDFVTPEGGGAVLTPAALRRYLAAYENWMLMEGKKGKRKRAGYRSILRDEVRRFLAFLRGQSEFQHYSFFDQDQEPCAISSLTI